MAVSIFHVGAHAYGLLTSVMATGSVMGVLLSARRAGPRMSLLVGGAAVFGGGCAIAAVMPSYGFFAATLVVIGIASQTFMIGANCTVQLASDPAKGRTPRQLGEPMLALLEICYVRLCITTRESSTACCPACRSP